MKIKLNECLGKTVIIKLIEDEEINTEFLIINSENDYNDLKSYINEYINYDILYDYYVYEN